MVRKPNKSLNEKIINALKNHPEGTYISEISRELKIPKSTVAYIINTRLKNEITDIKLGQKNLFRIIKLKPKPF